jgi:hypothetical protein
LLASASFVPVSLAGDCSHFLDQLLNLFTRFFPKASSHYSSISVLLVNIKIGSAM